MNFIYSLVIIAGLYANNEDSGISFQYGVLGHLHPQKEVITILQDSSKLHTGDEIRINVGYRKETYLYVIYKGSSDEFMLIYPGESDVTENQANVPDTIYDTALYWSPLSDPPGFETLYLINTDFALDNLSNLFKRYEKLNAKGQFKLAKKIQNEIDNLNPESIADLASITDSRLDQPVVGGVAFRGEDGVNLKDMSVTNTCKGEFGIAFKQIVLDHQ